MEDVATTFGTIPATKETFVDPIAVLDPVGDAKDVDPSIPPLSLYAMMQSLMTTQAAYGQLLDELLTEVAFLRADFLNYKSVFPPPPPFED